MSAGTVRATIIGNGGWGTALALHLAQQGHEVTLWGAFPDELAEIARDRENRKYLPGIPLPASLRFEDDLAASVRSAALLVLAVPSQYLRSVVRELRGTKLAGKTLLSVVKGLEVGTLKRMSQVVHDELGPVTLAVLSGPSIAREVASGQPASVVVASTRPAVRRSVQGWFMNPRLRIYTSADVVGVEVGGALKNPVAIAAGICDGLALGANAKAALMTRGLVEMARLGAALGGRQQTFGGLSGLGDLVTTCFSGRNRWLGEQLGRGLALRDVLASTPMVIEGVETARAAVALGKKRRVELPIIEQVHAILFEGRSPRAAVEALMQRTGKSER